MHGQCPPSALPDQVDERFPDHDEHPASPPRRDRGTRAPATRRSGGGNPAAPHHRAAPCGSRNRGPSSAYARVRRESMSDQDRPLFLVVTIKPRLDRLDEAEAQLQSMRRNSLTEPGCVFMHLVQAAGRPGHLGDARDVPLARGLGRAHAPALQHRGEQSSSRTCCASRRTCVCSTRSRSRPRRSVPSRGACADWSREPCDRVHTWRSVVPTTSQHRMARGVARW